MVNYWCSAADIRELFKLSTTLLTEVIALSFIAKAQEQVLKDITGYRNNSDLVDYSGNIISPDGITTAFFTQNKFLADTDYDKITDESDVLVYGWTDSEDPSTKVQLADYTVYWREGEIVFDIAPSSIYTRITASYRFYGGEPEWNLITLATAQYAGYLVAIREFLFMPTSLRAGRLALTYRWPWQELLKEYRKTTNTLLSSIWAISKGKRILREEADRVKDMNWLQRGTAKLEGGDYRSEIIK